MWAPCHHPPTSGHLENWIATSSTNSRATSGIQVAPTHAALFVVVFWLGLGLEAPDFGLLGHPLPLSPFAALLAPTYVPGLENGYVICLYVILMILMNSLFIPRRIGVRSQHLTARSISQGGRHTSPTTVIYSPNNTSICHHVRGFNEPFRVFLLIPYLLSSNTTRRHSESNSSPRASPPPNRASRPNLERSRSAYVVGAGRKCEGRHTV